MGESSTLGKFERKFWKGKRMKKGREGGKWRKGKREIREN